MGVSHVTVDKLIGRLEEFGPAYFILAQATGITPEQYRRIQGSVRGQALLHAGEEIPINADNAPRLAAAVEELRRRMKSADDQSLEPRRNRYLAVSRPSRRGDGQREGASGK